MKINENKIILMLLGILTGIIITSLFLKSGKHSTIFLTYNQYQRMGIEEIELKSEIKGLYNEINDSEIKLRNYNGSSGKTKSVLDTMSKELETARLFSGASNVQGPGIKVTVNDRHNYTNSDDVMDYITHNSDLLLLISELKNAGAEAISINGKRIINTTSITCEGPAIAVNGEYIVPPFVILAIGDPSAMQYVLSLPESHYQEMKLRGLYLKVEKENIVKIDGIERNNNLKYMKQSKQ